MRKQTEETAIKSRDYKARQLFHPSETDIKQQIRDYLTIKRIYNFPLVQGLGAHRGVPDRIFHYRGRVHYLEIKKPSGKLSPHQEVFRQQCELDGISFHVIHSLEDLQAIVG